MADSSTSTGNQKSPGLLFVYITGLITALASTATLAATIYTIVFLVRPNLKPPEKLGASISEVTTEADVSYDEFIKRTNVLRRDDIPVNQPGILLYIKVEIQGYYSRSYGIRMSLMDKKSNRPVGRLNKQRIRWSATQFQPAASSDGGTLYGWISMPSRGVEKGKEKDLYFVRMRLFDLGLAKEQPSIARKEPTKGMLDVADSKPFEWSTAVK